ncbi:hypothetical protein PPYR_02390 [Photinus pyralis]|uniref:DDE Tnp4 domain-containing protein n=2 Tax=Photinus pyralis TaxID=7054 RepID=A0A5N4B7T4_PHOPY|nr:hypothetical protein PPYR_02390 [Photinus pyralis]
MSDPSADMLKNSAERFKLKWNFDHCMGAIDGKHIQIKAPPKSGSSYFNYKKTFSIVLLAVVDADYRFLMIDVGSKGRFSDGGIFSSSFIGRRLRQGINLPEDEPLYASGSAMPYVVVGDEAFPLLKHLMRPYPGRNLAIEEGIFQLSTIKSSQNFRECVWNFILQVESTF